MVSLEVRGNLRAIRVEPLSYFRRVYVPTQGFLDWPKSIWVSYLSMESFLLIQLQAHVDSLLIILVLCSPYVWQRPNPHPGEKKCFGIFHSQTNPSRRTSLNSLPFLTFLASIFLSSSAFSKALSRAQFFHMRSSSRL